jgi:hypothetical protein
VLQIAVDARPAIFERVLQAVVSEPDRARRNEMYNALGRARDGGVRRTTPAKPGRSCSRRPPEVISRHA